MKYTLKKLFAGLLASITAMTSASALIPSATASDIDAKSKSESGNETEMIETIIREAVGSQKAHAGIGRSDPLLGSEKYLSGASSTATDWTAMAMARFGYYDANGEYQYMIDDGTGYEDYLDALRLDIETKYAEGGGLLDVRKSTEWHRAAMTVSALGGDPSSFGECGGQPIDLIADGSYNCVTSTGLGFQGINAWSWGLIALDLELYDVPDGAKYTRETIITEILSQQVADGVGGCVYGGWTNERSVDGRRLHRHGDTGSRALLLRRHVLYVH